MGSLFLYNIISDCEWQKRNQLQELKKKQEQRLSKMEKKSNGSSIQMSETT